MKRTVTFEEKWHEQAESYKEMAAKLPHGRERDELLRMARQLETALARRPLHGRSKPWVALIRQVYRESRRLNQRPVSAENMLAARVESRIE